MNAADRRRLTPALGIVVVVLALLLIALWSGWGRGAHWRGQAVPPKLPPLGATTPAPVVPPLEQFAAVWQHPLFSPTRTPEPAAGGEGAASGDLQLTGVILLPGLKMAILHDKTSNKDFRVIEGQPSQGGPTLVELHPRSAVVEASGSRLQLRLLPGPSPDAGNAQAVSGDGAQAVPAGSGGPGTSAMVSRHAGSGPGTGQARSLSGSGPQSVAARARALRARIEAERRKAQKTDGGH